MSDPALQPTDLGTYLGIPAIDTVRATMIINQATALCLSVVNPLPTGANAVLLDVCSRAYLNPGNLDAQAASPFSATYGAVSGGLWLTRQNVRTLRRLAGQGGAFMIDTVPAGTSSVQTITVMGAPTTGAFSIATSVGNTVSLDIASSAAIVQAAFNAVTNLSGVTVAGSPGAWTVTFPATLGPFPQISVASQTFTGGTQPTVLTGVLVVGVYPPGQNLPWWDVNGDLSLNGIGWPQGSL